MEENEKWIPTSWSNYSYMVLEQHLTYCKSTNNTFFLTRLHMILQLITLTSLNNTIGLF